MNEAELLLASYDMWLMNIELICLERDNSDELPFSSYGCLL